MDNDRIRREYRAFAKHIEKPSVFGGFPRTDDIDIVCCELPAIYQENRSATAEIQLHRMIGFHKAVKFM